MGLLQEWRDFAYSHDDNTQDGQEFWLGYFQIEKGIYEQLLAEPEVIVTGSVKELADKYNTTVSMMTGFLDGINDSLKAENPIDDMDEDTVVALDMDLEKLFYNMVSAKAQWLFELPVWDELLTEDKRRELYKESKSSTTVVKPPKIGRNDPCPCGSGKKYKKCCGK